LEKKTSTTIELLCRGFPAEFKAYFEHVRSLRFDDRPDYDYLKRLFRELFFRKGFCYDNDYDWEILAARNARRSEAEGEGEAPPGAGAEAGTVAAAATGATGATEEAGNSGGGGGGGAGGAANGANGDTEAAAATR
jgi:hypothetical protein